VTFYWIFFLGFCRGLNLRRFETSSKSSRKHLESRKSTQNGDLKISIPILSTVAMPISDEALQAAKNNFIAVKPEATLAQVAGALSDLGGEAWWHVVVQVADGSWSVARFNDLYASLRRSADAESMQLKDFPALNSAEAVTRDSLETIFAEAKARKSAAGVLVVTENDHVMGILVGRVKRSGAATAAPSLQELGGTSLDLKAYGAILLSSSKRSRPKAPPAKQS
jgi:hypothetical protein